MKRILCTQKKKITSNRHYRKTYPREICRKQKGMNRWAPGLNWTHPGWGCWNCPWLWDTMDSHKTRLIRNFLKWLLKGVSLFCPLPFYWRPEHQPWWRNSQFPSLISLCLPSPKALEMLQELKSAFVSCTGTIKPRVLEGRWLQKWQVMVHRQPGECSTCPCCSCAPCSAREAAGGDHALALSKAPDFWKCLPASRVDPSSQEIWEIRSQGTWLLEKG